MGRDPERREPLVQYSMELSARLEEETGLSAGCRRCGGVTVARTPDRLTQLKRTAATAAAYQLDCDRSLRARTKDRSASFAAAGLL